MMKIALVCIAGPIEKPYIDEWVEYHVKLGFDVFIFENNWSYLIKNDRVHVFQIPGEAQQLNAYNIFLKHFSNDYDWALMIDCDEFFNLNQSIDLQSCFSRYTDFNAVGFNWVIFGDSNLKTFDSNKVLNRFTMCQKTLDHHVKTAVNLVKCRNSVLFNNPHCTINDCMDRGFKISADLKNFISGPYNEAANELNPLDYRFPYINHYFCKTFQEYKIRRAYGKADFKKEINGVKVKDKYRSDEEFFKYNHNDIINTTILNHN